MSTCLVCGKEGYHPHGVPMTDDRPAAPEWCECQRPDGLGAYIPCYLHDARPTPEPAPAPDLTQHRPTLWPNDTITPIHCSCGLRDHMDGWWAHLRVEVVEPMLRAAPADLLSVEALDVEILAAAIYNCDLVNPVTFHVETVDTEAARIAAEYARLRASSRGAP